MIINVITLLLAKSEEMIHLGCSIFQSVSPYVRQSEKLVHNSTEFHFFFSYFPTIPPYHTPPPPNPPPPPPTTKITHPPGMVITPQTTIRDGRVRFFIRNWSIRNWIYWRLRFKKLESCKFKILESLTTLFLGNLVRGKGQKFLKYLGIQGLKVS